MKILSTLRPTPFIAALALLLVCARTAAAETLTLMWDLNAEPEVTGYRVHVGTESGVYVDVVDVGLTDTFVLSTAVPGQRYCFAVSAYAGALTSPLSSEICASDGNVAPYLSRPLDQAHPVGVYATLLLSGGDDDGDGVTYGASGLPAGLALNPSSGLISGTPTAAGTSAVLVSVSDGLQTATQGFTWTIFPQTSPVNVAPVLTAPGPQTSTVGDTVNVQLSASDADGDVLSFSATGLPNGLALTSTGGIAGTVRKAGQWNVAVTVSDGRVSTLHSFAWVVLAKDSGRSRTPRAATGSSSSQTTTAAEYTGETAHLRTATETASTTEYVGTAAVPRPAERGPATATAPVRVAKAIPTADLAAVTPSGGTRAVAVNRDLVRVTIQTPVDRFEVKAGTPILFAALVSAVTGSDIIGEVVWASDQDGVLGTGRELVTQLAPGDHVVTASVKDGAGRTNSARILVQVN